MLAMEGRRPRRRGLSYDDVLLIPQYSDIQSRAEIDLSIDFGSDLSLDLPIFSSPMDTVSGAQMAAALSTNGAAAVLHRYNTVAEQTDMLQMALHNGATHVGVAVGIAGDYIERATIGIKAGARFICVDVAHGHHSMMKEALAKLRSTLGPNIHIMAGNVATLAGVNDLSDWGADSVRCNIGGGSICSTRIQTGHGIPGLQTVMDCARTDRDVKIIADGGIRNSGDIVKALAAGADAIMCGSLIAGTRETPGAVVKDSEGRPWKVYRGMASKEAQMNWRGKYSSFEGVSARIPYRGPVAEIIKDVEKGIRSGLSYSGCRTIAELQAKSEFMIQTAAGQAESNTHITHRNW